MYDLPHSEKIHAGGVEKHRNLKKQQTALWKDYGSFPRLKRNNPAAPPQMEKEEEKKSTDERVIKWNWTENGNESSKFFEI